MGVVITPPSFMRIGSAHSVSNVIVAEGLIPTSILLVKLASFI